MLKIQKRMKILLIFAILGIGGVPLQIDSQTGLWSETYTVSTLNGHSGYTTEWRAYDQLDKPIIIVLGYDPGDDDTAVGAANGYSDLILDMNNRGWDIIIFDYLDGDADIRNNAENLADFVNYLDSRMEIEGYTDSDGDGHPDYDLSLVGGSMGGIVSRTMFVQENENMGVNTFITLDSPHYGVYISAAFDWATGLFSDAAAKQMIHGTPEYNDLYGSLQSAEQTSDFRNNVIGPMDTAAIALSNGESSWTVSWGDLLIHTKYHPVSSYYDLGILGTTDFIPYHSAVYLDSDSTSTSYRWGYNKYSYRSTQTSYFDTKIVNARAAHGGPTYAILEAMNFIETH